MSSISAGTTTGTALVSTGDTTGQLDLKINGTTQAVRINTSGAIGVGTSPAYGTSGQFLTSGGSGAAPSWTSVTPTGTATATASGSIAAGALVVLNSDGTVSQPTGSVLTSQQYTKSLGSANGFYYGSECAEASDGKVLMCNNSAGKIVVYDPANLTFGTAVSSTFGNYRVVYDESGNIFIGSIAGGTASTAYLATATVSGTTPTVGSAQSITTFSNGTGSVFCNGLFSIGNGYYVATFYRESGTSYYWSKWVTFSLSGSTISVATTSTEVRTDTTSVPFIGGLDSVSNYVVMIFKDTYGGSVASYAARLYTNSSGTLTQVSTASMSTAQTTDVLSYGLNFLNGGAILSPNYVIRVSGTSIVYYDISGDTVIGASTYQSTSPNGKVFVSYYYGNPSQHIAYIHTFDGYSVKLAGLPIQFLGSNYEPYVFAGNQYVLMLSGWFSTSTYYVKTAVAPSSNAYWYYGVNTTSVTNGQTATINTFGAVNSSQSSLVVGKKVYSSGTGVLSSSPSPIVVGTALSATSLLIGG